MSAIPNVKHELAGKRIIVSGAGLAGLAFVRALEQNWPELAPKPEVIVYERSSKALDKGREGYTMGIKPESGLQALKELGLLDVAVRSSTTGVDKSQQLPTFWTKNWQPILQLPTQPPPKGGLPPNGIRLVRHVLRQLLLDALPATTKVHWGNGCESIQVLEDGKVLVTTSNGSEEYCDFLIAADGANSKIRSHFLPDDKLDFAGAVCFLGTSRFPSGKPDLLKDAWGINISGQGVPFLTFPVDSETGVWALSYRTNTPRTRIRGKEAVERQKEMLDEVRERGRMFQEPFNQFIEATDPETLQVFSAMHKYPINHFQKLPHANVVLIGDANHPMSPFSGNGANMALMDALQLAKQLTSCESVRTAIEKFDAESGPRSKKAIDRSWWIIRVLHSQGIVFWGFRALVGVVGFFMGLKKVGAS
jgi:2-polyprenyl-6-methoxyphenol hydroxylase-like FAD-dependent oxidoreductase